MEFIEKYLPQIWPFLSSSRIFGGILIVIGFAILAWLVDVVLRRIFSRLVGKTRFQFDDALLKAVHRPIWISILMIGAITGIRWISPEAAWTNAIEALLKSLMAIIWALAVNRIIIRIVDDAVAYWRSKGRQGSEIIGLGGNIVRMLLLVGIVFLLLAIWKINITPLLASAGIAGVAVALAAKETLSNFFGGVSVLLDQPYKVGDYIVLDSGERGEVVDIGLRSTRILTRDDVLVSIPNAIITNTKIVNESAPEPRFRVRIKIGVAYGSDIDQVEEILLSLTKENRLVAPEPSPRVRFRAFGDSSLDFELLCWAHRPHDKGRLIHELNRSIYKAFNAAGVSIPFPQRDVHLFYPHSESKVADD